ncbi:MAG: hypothetical protein A3F31_01155 [Candidatus Levybacteria bacterium RIFCSPHIGHO2_12_FULL_38_12]|nr:MAG: hypothetical protein A2770_01775 [Candidatus Levybacteria bacterium RIFCSPHIGHO2_01_FULL_38_12]OGH22025.1 MAG: hypothetical protein A3D75_03305 [Candidatus Levybacteria bacterium RIFCSPHIGHO2_02_FULL_37_18]OGH23257.1 MAG: hypothetical protein A3F31_01155 [Candidatus Levybacteria bacterium RIFCSPHIGHO2_12_FULL_38_12]OGH33718.1 MAG: hypothetical protein A3A47_02740 [Candidatus Levybacteria bacterium RIFCSPLOWO2_01_FULL_37_20]OGH44624.1 MAG: hypothetical protein A3J14_00825 [Candidatus Lev
MIKKTPTINLFTGRSKSFIDRFLKWALSVGRLIIILTEIIALSAFLYRFSLDRQLIDLRDKIKSQQKILDLYKNNEKKYRSLQERIALSSQLSTLAEKNTDTLNKINQSIPINMSVSSLTLQKKSMNINASVPSISTLTSFMKKIKSFPEVKGTTLERIDNRISSSTLVFSLNVFLKDE